MYFELINVFNKTVYFFLNCLTQCKKSLLNLFLKFYTFTTLRQIKKQQKKHILKSIMFSFYFKTSIVCCDQLMLKISVFLFDQKFKRNAGLRKLQLIKSNKLLAWLFSQNLLFLLTIFEKIEYEIFDFYSFLLETFYILQN